MSFWSRIRGIRSTDENTSRTSPGARPGARVPEDPEERRLIEAITKGRPLDSLSRDEHEEIARIRAFYAGRPPVGVVSDSGCGASLADRLSSAMHTKIPGDWTAYRSGQLLVSIPFPGSWPVDEGKSAIIIRPTGSKGLTEGDRRIVFSPGFTFMAGTNAELRDGALLEAYREGMSKTFENFRARESTILTLRGIQTLAVLFDFSRPSGEWTCLLTLRVKNDVFWYFDVSGQRQQLLASISTMLPVLASVRFFDSREAFEVDARNTHAPPVRDAFPEGASVGVLFEIRRCKDVSYGRVFEQRFFDRVGAHRLAGCRLYTGDILPECRYYCIRIDAPDPEIPRYVRNILARVGDEDGFVPPPHRFVSGENLQREPLCIRGVIDSEGRVISR